MRAILLLLLIPASVSAADVWHRDHVMNIALLSSAYKASPNLLWFSNLRVGNERTPVFLDASGRMIAENPSVVRSGYDSDISYDVSEMYTPRNRRLTFIANFSFDSPGLIWSVGFDSGVETSKLQVDRGIFLGATKAFELSSRSHFAVGSGAWIGGKISETPCFDSYDRSYWCRNLTAWTDYRPQYPRQGRYLDFRYLYQF